jgi:phage baseplate assembly protein W
MSWGDGSWGGSGWGGDPADSGVEYAFALAVRIVRVRFRGAMQSSNGLRLHDAQNAQVWTVQELDSLGAVASTNPVIGVVARSPLMFDLALRDDLRHYPVPYKVLFATLYTAAGVPVPLPRFYDFLGVGQSRSRVQQRTDVLDLRNDPNPNGQSMGGTLIVNTTGGYSTESGVELLRKLIIRRLITSRGGFYHLPNYGAGLAVKEPVRPADLARVRRQLADELAQEPDVVVSSLQLELRDDNTMFIIVNATLRATGEGDQITVPVSFRGR